MRYFPLATVDGKEPVYSDDFDPQGTHIGRKHAGIDIYADLGTPVLAVDAGELRHAHEKNAGNVMYLYVPDFAHRERFFWYGHLDHYSGAVTMLPPYRVVEAGETLGVVGHTGLTDVNHLHFEIHETGGGVIDPYASLQSAEHLAMSSTLIPAKALGGPLAAKALAAAYQDKHGAAAPAAALVLPLAQAIGEGTTGQTYAGTNNWGSMHATSGWANAHNGDSGYGMFAHLDSGYAGPYITRLELNPSPKVGARSFLDRVEYAVGGDINAIPGVNLQTLGAQDVFLYCERLYATGYFTMGHPDVTPLAQRAEVLTTGAWTADDSANIYDYAALVTKLLPQAQAAIAAMPQETADPATVNVGPPFAPLAERLTPGRPPHTLAHARELLGKNADNPPAGAISLHDATQAGANHDGIWVFVAPPGTPAPQGPQTPDTPTSSPARDRVIQVVADVAAVVAAGLIGAVGGVAIDRYVLPALSPKKRRSPA